MAQQVCPQCKMTCDAGCVRCPRCNKLLLQQCKGNCCRCKEKDKCSG